MAFRLFFRRKTKSQAGTHSRNFEFPVLWVFWGMKNFPVEGLQETIKGILVTTTSMMECNKVFDHYTEKCFGWVDCHHIQKSGEK